jgi:U1 small nuclear ribonucleoprotein 70kDa
MPGTHLLPPNLLKLFAPRPPLTYSRPVDKDIDRVTKKNVSGVGTILASLKEGAMTGLANGTTTDGMEEGEEPTFTLAEEIKRQIRREDRKKRRAEEFQVAKESCTRISSSPKVYLTLFFPNSR